MLYGTFKPFRFYFFFSSTMKWPERLGRGGHCKDIYQRSQVSLVFTQLANIKHESICYKNMLHSKHDLPVFYSRKLFKYFSITFLFTYLLRSQKKVLAVQYVLVFTIFYAEIWIRKKSLDYFFHKLEIRQMSRTCIKPFIQRNIFTKWLI